MKAEIIAEYIIKHYEGKIVEVGIGYNWRIAKILAEKGLDVVVTDIKPIEIPYDNIKFVIDDIMSPKKEIYKGASLIYSLRPPPELYSYILSIAKDVKADCLIRPFGNEFASGKLVNYKGERFYLWINR
ncbi:MAG TPA: hypothetical protein EYH04_04420 [Archaeoglobus profundus]|nr:hypothetical protein [Archaeoglobus profundus]